MPKAKPTCWVRIYSSFCSAYQKGQQQNYAGVCAADINTSRPSQLVRLGCTADAATMAEEYCSMVDGIVQFPEDLQRVDMSSRKDAAQFGAALKARVEEITHGEVAQLQHHASWRSQLELHGSEWASGHTFASPDGCKRCRVEFPQLRTLSNRPGRKSCKRAAGIGEPWGVCALSRFPRCSDVWRTVYVWCAWWLVCGPPPLHRGRARLPNYVAASRYTPINVCTNLT